MTTVAYDGKTLAADTRYMEGTHRHGLTRKLFLLPNGCVVGNAGTIGLSAKLIEGLTKKKRPGEYLTKKELKECDCLLITPDGEAKYLDAPFGDFLPVDEPHTAIGSGAEIAITLMRMGYSAKEAIGAVAKTHVTTNDLVDVYHIKTQAFSLASFD